MKKKIIISVATLIILPSLMGFSCSSADAQGSTFVIQDTAHEIAELARSLGLPEDDPIIVRAQEIWWDAEEQFCNDRDIIATVIYNEAGYDCSDRHMELVAAVIYNRLQSDKFPDTVYEIVTAPKQYHPDYAKAKSKYGKRARESEIWSKCQEIATRALNGEIDCPSDVFFQANFVQGKEIYETHYTSYSTTWFCRG